MSRRTTRAASTLVAALSAAALLSACGGMKSALGVTEPPVAVTTVASLAPEQAKTILNRVWSDAILASGTGDQADQARASAYTAQALEAARARSKLAPIQPPSGGPAPLATQTPGLLTVSRGPAYPRVVVAQAIPSTTALPVLHLLITPDVRTPFRIASSATMLPSSSVNRFPPLTEGSVVNGDTAQLVVQPAALLDAYAKALTFTTALPASTPFAGDRFLSQVRERATAQAKAVVTQATFGQSHAVDKTATYSIGQQDGSALVFGVIKRTDTFKVKTGQTITSPREFVALVPGKSKITRQATMTTLQFVVFEVPASGQARLVAADDQLVTASGS